MNAGNPIYGAIKNLYAFHEDHHPTADPLRWIRSREAGHIWSACAWRFQRWMRKTHGKYQMSELMDYVPAYITECIELAEDPWTVHIEATALGKILNTPISSFIDDLPAWNLNDYTCYLNLDDYLAQHLKLACVIAEQDIFPGRWIIRIDHEVFLDSSSDGHLAPVITRTPQTAEDHIRAYFDAKDVPIIASGEQPWGKFYAQADSPSKTIAAVTRIRKSDLERLTHHYLVQAERQILINSFLLSENGMHCTFPNTDTPAESLARIYNSCFASEAIPWIISNELRLNHV